MSLREFLKKMNVEVQKEEMDYSIIRYPWTPVTNEELSYCIADVVGLYQALQRQFKTDGSNMSSVPLTSTGYVRADFKSAMRRGGYLSQVRECSPDYDLYLALRRAFRGGNTHANRCYTGIILENVQSYDMSSAYPAAIVNMPFPIKPFTLQTDVHDPEDLLDGFPYVFCIEFRNIKLRDPFDGCPYFSIHKTYDLRDAINDNGRIIEAKHFKTWITDVDFSIIREQYVWEDARITRGYMSEYGLLPKAMRDVTMQYFRKKTELKGVAGQEVYYAKAKAKLNSIYGMTATNPVRTNVIFNGHDFEVEEQDEKEALAKSNKRAFCTYATGVWVTAHCRRLLHDAINLCGHNFVYCDTDSVKFVGDVDFTALNDRIRALSERRGAYADDPAGNRHYLGVFEHDAHYKRFKTLGAKKYAYEDDVGKLHITIAGVSKSGADELGCLENFEDFFVFRYSAGQEATYNDDWIDDPLIIDGHILVISPNIYLHEAEYTIGLTAEYKKLFQLTQEQLDKIMKTR